MPDGMGEHGPGVCRAVRDVHAPVDNELLGLAHPGRLDVLEQVPVVDDPVHTAGGPSGDDFDATAQGPGHCRHRGGRPPELGMGLGDGPR